MKTIYKYLLDVQDEQEVSLPVGARILSIAMQQGKLCLWAEVDPDPTLMLVNVPIYLYGIEHPIDVPPNKRRFICTLLLNEGSLVLHAFEGLT
jgi:hypothetical protein